MKNYKVGFFCLLLLVYTPTASAQSVNMGLPPVTHFAKTAYQAGTQSWDIGQDQRGFIFLANNEGLLCYNGNTWHCYPISNGTCVRSLAIDSSQQRIYVGGQGELGFFSPDISGKLVYHSLNPVIPDAERGFGDVWDIVFFQGAYFFSTADRVFRIQENQCTVYRPLGYIQHLEAVGNRLLLNSSDTGMLFFNGQGFVPLCAGPPGVVTAMLPWQGDTVLITTLKNGIFVLVGDRLTTWSTAADPFLKEKRIYTAALLGKDRIALGTTLGGLVVLQSNRRPEYWLRKGSGLQYNNILSVSPDRAGNLWLGLDNGIDYVEMNAPFYRISPDGDLEGAGYCARLSGGRLYLGTSNGLYGTAWQQYFNPFVVQPFQSVSGTTGQVWGLNEVSDAFLMGHHEGAFRIEGYTASPLNNRTGTWRYLQLNDTVLVAGQYDGLSLLTRHPGGAWQWRGKVAGMEESCRILAPENDSTMWMSHPYRGVFKIVFQRGFRQVNVQRYGQAEGLPSDLFNYVFFIGGRALVAGEHGLFRYDAGSNRFVSDTAFDEQLGKTKRTRLLQEDAAGNIWFVTGEETGVLWIRDEGLGKKIRRQVFPQLNGQIVGGFEHIYCLDMQNFFFGTEKGFMHLNTQRLSTDQEKFQVVINGVRIPQAADSVVYGGFRGQGIKEVVLPYQNNRIVISYAATVFGDSRRIQYNTRLEGLEREWSGWSSQMERDFSHLPAGTYRLLVKARSETGLESAVEYFSFRILPPWYASNWAFFFYLLLFAGLLTMLIRSQRKRFEREKAELTRSHQQKEALHLQRAEQTEQELIRVQNEKLEAEVQHKNEELALATMHLVQKGELIATIQEALERILQNVQQPAVQRQELQRLLRVLQVDTRTDQDWEQFAVHFDQVYRDFLQRLRERFSQLSPNDYRLCAYLRMNLNTKEIAHLMNISVRGVEGSRYRLRRKLNLPNDANLVDFLMSV